MAFMEYFCKSINQKQFTSSLETAIIVEALGATLWGHVDVENLVVGNLVLFGSVLTHL